MDRGGGSWFRRHRSRLVVAGIVLGVAFVVVLAVMNSPRTEMGALLVAIVGVLAPVVMWALDRREKHAEKARLVAGGVTAESPPPLPPPLPPPHVDLPRLVVDPAGTIGGGDRAAAMAYVQQLKELPAPQRRVRTALTSASAQVVEDPDLDRARAEFERLATRFAQGHVVYPWGPPSAEDWAVALETLWVLSRHGSRASSTAWYAWPPGGAGDPVAFGVPPDDELVRRASGRFSDRPLHIQRLDPRIVWRWLAPAAVRSAVSDEGVRGLPVVLDDWRVSARAPQQLASVEPERRSGHVASSSNRAWGW